ncbi:hypothetical protein FEM48_Zijuj12G0123800 [Ziziphus jujuba var. spinosa]|uniref:Probable purine permease n=1 Tax=Ziziphus jujuba var. spinosa TaxID=714518 RepID=A0A978UDB0_ZIZJJ|nr:hypothetical protein FEM48_Zijuj12G0123800 [Ziziphus jujuba var. spinosa]
MQELILVSEDQKPLPKLKHWKWWLMVAFNVAFLLVGQSAATVLGRFYFKGGGESLWMATLVQSAAFPVLLLPRFFLPSAKSLPTESTTTTFISKPSVLSLASLYFFLGTLLAGDNFLYSVGLHYLPLSTYSLLCAAQLAFNAIFSFFINSQKFTALILNSVVIISLSASLISDYSESSDQEDHEKKDSKAQYTAGFSCTLAASAGYALLLSLMQFSFEKILKKESFSVVLDMQIYTSFVATLICIVGLFASGEWKDLKCEMERSEKGKAVYVMTLVGIALAWQVCSVGVVGLIFIVSSLFSNVVSMFTLPLAPLGGVVLYKEKMDGVKVVAMLLAIWGFASYIYQQYLDDQEAKTTENNGSNAVLDSSSS